MNSTPSTFNERVGANLQRLRKLAGLSQADLAHELSQHHGLSFQQQTVLKVEKGSRPLKFDEAHAIAEVLGVSASVLPNYTGDQERTAATSQLRSAESAIAVAEAELSQHRQAIGPLEDEIAHWRVLADEARRRLGALDGQND